MSNVFNNSIWPNGLQDAPEGHPEFYPLGTNKTEVPDGITTMWPDGDKLIGDFVYKNDKVVGFIDTKALIPSTSGTTTMNYSYIDINLPSIYEHELTVNAPNATFKKITWAVSTGSDDNVIVTLKYKGCKTVDDVKAVDPDYQTTDIVDGVWSEGLGDLKQGGNGQENSGMFYDCSNLTSFSSDLSSLTDGYGMFWNCKNLTTFSSDLSSLTNGYRMFYGCENLTSFNSDLSSLTYGASMFEGCSNLTLFSSDLSSLTSCIGMFNSCTNLNSFSSDLRSLTKGGSMFQNCTNLTSFSSDLSSLTSGEWMFYNCKNLTSFSSDLSSLTAGYQMFYNCKLDVPSVKNIIDTINTYSAKLTLGMGCNNTTEDKDLFALEVGYDNITSLLAALQAKGWTVSVQYKGRPTTTYGLRRPSEDTLPVFVKLEEDEKYADYTSEDESKKYRLNWFHETTGSTEGYEQFNSLEEAVAFFNVKPIDRNR